LKTHIFTQTNLFFEWRYQYFFLFKDSPFYFENNIIKNETSLLPSLVTDIRRVWFSIRKRFLPIRTWFILFLSLHSFAAWWLWWFFWIFPKGMQLRRLFFASPQICQWDIARLDLFPWLPSQEMWVRYDFDTVRFTKSIRSFHTNGPRTICHRCSVFKLEASIAFVFVLMEKDDGFSCGIVDAGLLRCLCTIRLTSKILCPCPKTLFRN